jgi:anti-sigma regulatory factor (Ser/Thr protein kinase)
VSRSARLIAITDPTMVSAARREASVQSQASGLDEIAAGNLAIIVTEAATNLLKHVTGGSIIVGVAQNSANPCVFMLALDKGKGMQHVEAFFDDGFSTAGTAGTGLGAIRRGASSFDIYSGVEKGTALLASVGELVANIGSIALPLAGEQHSGDGCAVVQRSGRTLLLVVDGLGHGIYASEAAEEAIRVFEDNAAYSPAEIMRIMHDSLRKTRGAAAAIAEVDHGTSIIRFCGIGNISGAITNGGTKIRNMVSYNGTLGHQIIKIQEFSYPIIEQELLIMHSDGVSASWDLSRFPGLTQRHPLVIAGMILRDHRRQRDDASITVMRYQGKVA